MMYFERSKDHKQKAMETLPSQPLTLPNVADMHTTVEVNISDPLHENFVAAPQEEEKKTVDKNRYYIENDCYSTTEFKELVRAGKFGKGVSIKEKPTWTKGSNKKILIKFSQPGNEDKSVPFKASIYEGNVYFNKKSVMFFINKSTSMAFPNSFFKAFTTLRASKYCPMKASSPMWRPSKASRS